MTELAAKKSITSEGGRHQRNLVVYIQNNSGIKWTSLSGRFGLVRSATTTRSRSARMWAPV